MKLIVGLGNSGEKYERTRHNAGFMVVEKLWELENQKKINLVRIQFEKKFSAEMCKCGEVLLVKPQLFMNRSGEVVRKLVDYFGNAGDLAGRDFDNLVVIHDDLDIVAGEWKFKFGSGPKSHNGVNSVRQALGTDKFWYARVGVEGRSLEERQRISGMNYVLQPLSKDVTEEMIKPIEQVALVLEEWIGKNGGEN